MNRELDVLGIVVLTTKQLLQSGMRVNYDDIVKAAIGYGRSINVTAEEIHSLLSRNVGTFLFELCRGHNHGINTACNEVKKAEVSPGP